MDFCLIFYQSKKKKKKFSTSTIVKKYCNQYVITSLIKDGLNLFHTDFFRGLGWSGGWQSVPKTTSPMPLSSKNWFRLVKFA
jgi:hypothetical protein